MVIFDANMILRYLLNDNEEMADIAEDYIEKGTVSVTIEVIAEVVYVLKGVYSLERNEISEIVKNFLKLVSCRDLDILNIAFDAYQEYSLDFIDCVLYAYNEVRGNEIATFDKKLLSLIKRESR